MCLGGECSLVSERVSFVVCSGWSVTSLCVLAAEWVSLSTMTDWLGKGQAVLYQWRELPEVEFLCRDENFVTTSMSFVTTKVCLSQ